MLFVPFLNIQKIFLCLKFSSDSFSVKCMLFQFSIVLSNRTCLGQQIRPLKPAAPSKSRGPILKKVLDKMRIRDLALVIPFGQAATGEKKFSIYHFYTQYSSKEKKSSVLIFYNLLIKIDDLCFASSPVFTHVIMIMKSKHVTRSRK